MIKPSRIIKKRHVTLLELLIALALTVAILMTLTFFYRQVTEIGIEVDRTGEKNFNMRYIETRLAAIIPRAVAKSKSDFLFFSVGDEGVTKAGSQSLIFIFDNAVDLDKAFASHVLARIYLDGNGNLMVAYWPSPKRWENEAFPMKKELLMQGVENLTFEFYIAPARKENENPKQEAKPEANDEKEEESEPKEEKTVVEPEPQGNWRRENWLQEYKQLPVMVKILVTLKGIQQPFVLVYPLANTKSHVVYE